MTDLDWAGDPRSWIYLARVREVIDGDTVEAEIDVGFRWSGTLVLRLLGSKRGVQCPEMKDPDPKVRAAARRSKNRTQELLPVGAEFWAITDKPLERAPDGGFARWLSQAIKRDGTNVGDVLLEEGFGAPYARRRAKKKEAEAPVTPPPAAPPPPPPG